MNILVTALTSAELLKAQAAALERFMGCSYRLVVVNDARTEKHFSNLWSASVPEKIEAACTELGAAHWRFPQPLHLHRDWIFPDEPAEYVSLDDANSRCADAIQYGVNQLLADTDEPLLILDADIVPYRTVDPLALLEQHPVWGYPQNRGAASYLWNGLLLVDPARAAAMETFNLDCGQVSGVPVDVGGQLHRFVAANDGNIGTFPACSAGYWRFNDRPETNMPPSLVEFFRWDCDAHDGYRVAETYGDLFVHLGAGGNWEVREVHGVRERTRRFIDAVSKVTA